MFKRNTLHFRWNALYILSIIRLTRLTSEINHFMKWETDEFQNLYQLINQINQTTDFSIFNKSFTCFRKKYQDSSGPKFNPFSKVIYIFDVILEYHIDDKITPRNTFKSQKCYCGPKTKTRLGLRDRVYFRQHGKSVPHSGVLKLFALPQKMM